MFQSPSLRGSGRFAWSAAPDARRSPVSIPFIAGQWSLQAEPWLPHARQVVFQSPSLRGSGRFAQKAEADRDRAQVSIPFIAGQWSLPAGQHALVVRRRHVSIPFIAGQWSLRFALGDVTVNGRVFQSPSLRGSGRFLESMAEWNRAMALFQSPSLRGSGRFRHLRHWLPGLAQRFNPLHCGAVVASGRSGKRTDFNVYVSIPFIAGQWSLLPRTTPSSLFGVLLRKRRLPCDHIICTRLPF